MNSLIKNMLILFSAMSISFSLTAQNQWVGKLSLSDIDCNRQTACYKLAIKGTANQAWKLGDQNYRLFFDAAKISIIEVTSLLPANFYNDAQVNEILELTGLGQEAFSPLDNIDKNLGFLDFNIVAYRKQLPHLATEINKNEFMPIAEICVEVSEEMLNNTGEENALNLLFSRPETAGQITQQFTVLSELDMPNHTIPTEVMEFVDVTYDNGYDGQLGMFCRFEKEEVEDNARLKLFPNPTTLQETLTYKTMLSEEEGTHDVIIQDVTGRIVADYRQLASGNQEIRLPANLSIGTYIFKILSEKRSFTDKLVIVD